MRILLSIAIALSFASGACGGGDDGGGTGPTAPSNLAAMPLAGGAHLTWTDNSNDEDEFMIMRMVDGGEYAELTTVPFDTTQYHDTTVTAATRYMYMVMATNAAGASESNEVVFDAP